MSMGSPPPPVIRLKGGFRGDSTAAAERLQGTAEVGGGYWRLEMRLGLALGYGNAFWVESGPES